jgi:hypothetical protein
MLLLGLIGATALTVTIDFAHPRKDKNITVNSLHPRQSVTIWSNCKCSVGILGNGEGTFSCDCTNQRIFLYCDSSKRFVSMRAEQRTVFGSSNSVFVNTSDGVHDITLSCED